MQLTSAHAPLPDSAAAIEALQRVLGPDSVDVTPPTITEFRNPYWLQGSPQYDFAAVVSPRSVEEVQATVRVANEHGSPLWSFSQGRNNGYGGPAAPVRGAIAVNLREMNRVLEVNEDLAYAVVEPGVRFFDLHDALAERGRTLWGPSPDLGWGSVIGNSLENGRGYTAYGDHGSQLCGLEVVLPSGDLLRTGFGAMSNGRTWHTYPHGFGPSYDGIFKQSSFGIVTSAGVWLMRRPQKFAVCTVTIHGDDLLGPLVEGLRELLLQRVIDNPPAVGRGIAGSQKDIEGDSWVGRFALYGSEGMVDAKLREVQRAFATPGMEFESATFAGDDPEPLRTHDIRIMIGVPDLELLDLFKEAYGENTGHLDFSPVGPLTTHEVLKTVRLMRDTYAKHNNPYICDLVVLPRCVIHISTTLFDTSDEVQTRHVYASYDELVRTLSAEGYPLYRTNTNYMDVVTDQLDFNDHALRRFTETIKDAIDPNGILQPGKQGIWGSRWRTR